GPLRAEYSEYAGNIVSAGQHLNGLLDDLADLEVVEADDFTTEHEEVDLGDAARRAAGILGVRARAKNIELLLPIRDNAFVAVGEFRRVLQILINLIGNAIAYSPENSLVTVRADRLPDIGMVVVTVSDEGPGVDEDQVAHIFDKFERLGRDNDGGSGLGLYISSRLAEAMDGTLDVANVGEEGATFRLTLPMDSSK
ncbi:MAG: HAMP domain-containing sensor histidine kinase, partial [Pseudomonadota bacterium]